MWSQLALLVWAAAAPVLQATPCPGSEHKGPPDTHHVVGDGPIPTVFAAADVLERDVLIIGGGATGTHAAVKLRDANRTVVVVERQERLGGHVNTFVVDAKSGTHIDYGTQAYIDNDQTRDFFGRFGVALNASALSPLPSRVVDFNAGVALNASAPNPTELLGPLAKYLAVTLPFAPFIGDGAYDLPPKGAVPEDLLLPFGEFVDKYKLGAAVPVVWIFAHGVGDLLNMTTLYVLQNFGMPHLLGLQAGYLYAPEGNQLVYDRAAEFLGDDVLFSSTVAQIRRPDAAGDGSSSSSSSDDERKDGHNPGEDAYGQPQVVNGPPAWAHEAAVRTPGGWKLVRARKLLVTIPPTLANLAPLGLDDAEQAVFGEWLDVPYFVGVVAGDTKPTTAADGDGAVLPDLTNFLNADTSAPPYYLPGSRGEGFVWRLESLGVPGYQTVKVVGERASAAAQGLVAAGVKKVAQALSEGPSAETGTKPKPFAGAVQFAAWEQHTDLMLHVKATSVRDGFYTRLYALQGRRDTWYTGNAWCSDYSPLLWQFTEKKVLPFLK